LVRTGEGIVYGARCLERGELFGVRLGGYYAGKMAGQEVAE
jgi:predicted esterase YcpF (UPF0227 family)